MLGTLACIGVPVDPAGAHHAYRLTGVVRYPPAANGDLSGAHRRAAFRLAGREFGRWWCRPRLDRQASWVAMS
jgi:hypothetical protein